MFLDLVLWGGGKRAGKNCKSVVGRVSLIIGHSSKGSEGSLGKTLFIGNWEASLVLVDKLWELISDKTSLAMGDSIEVYKCTPSLTEI